jgi:hypothetical protein
MIMSNYKSLMETNPTPNNPLVALTTRIEEVIASERFEVALSALVSAALRLETAKCGGNTAKAAEHLAHALKQIARKSGN